MAVRGPHGDAPRGPSRIAQSVEHLPSSSTTLTAARAENSLERRRPRGLPPRGRSCLGACRGQELTPEDIESHPSRHPIGSLPTGDVLQVVLVVPAVPPPRLLRGSAVCTLHGSLQFAAHGQCPILHAVTLTNSRSDLKPTTTVILLVSTPSPVPRRPRIVAEQHVHAEPALRFGDHWLRSCTIRSRDSRAGPGTARPGGSRSDRRSCADGARATRRASARAASPPRRLAGRSSRAVKRSARP